MIQNNNIFVTYKLIGNRDHQIKADRKKTQKVNSSNGCSQVSHPFAALILN